MTKIIQLVSEGVELQTQEPTAKPGLPATALSWSDCPNLELPRSKVASLSEHQLLSPVFAQEYYGGNSGFAWKVGLNKMAFVVSFNPESHMCKDSV